MRATFDFQIQAGGGNGKKKGLAYRIRRWFWDTRLGDWLGTKLGERCENCPLCEADYSDYRDTGYIGAFCGLHKGNEAEGCLTPRLIILVIHRRRVKQYEKQLAAELAEEERIEEEYRRYYDVQ